MQQLVALLVQVDRSKSFVRQSDEYLVDGGCATDYDLLANKKACYLSAERRAYVF